MAVTVSHAFTCPIPDDPVAAGKNQVLPQAHWNALHVVHGTESLPTYFVPTSGGDDTAAIQAAITAAGVAGGGIVNLGAGVYNTSSTAYSIWNNVYIQGAGREVTILRKMAGWVSITSPTDPSLTLTGVITFCGVTGFGCDGIGIDGVTHPSGGNGITDVPTLFAGAGTPCSNGYITNCKVFLQSGVSYLIWSQRGRHVRIENNWCDGGQLTPTSGVDQNGIECYGGYNVKINFNTVEHICANAINLITISATTPNCSLSRVTCFENDIAACDRGIYGTASFDATNGDAYLRDVNLLANNIDGCWTAGIVLSPSNASCTIESISILDNIIRGPASGGVAASRAIALDNGSNFSFNSRAITIEDNQCIDIPLTDQGGMMAFQQFSNFTVRGGNLVNSATALGSGNALGLYVVGCTNFDIDGLVINGARLYGVQYDTCSFFRHRGGQVLNWNLKGVGTAAMTFSTVHDFSVEDVDFDTSTMTSVGSIVNLGGTAITKLVVRNQRYLNSNGNIGTVPIYAFASSLNWATGTAYARKDVVRPTSGGTGFYFECVTAGTSHATTQPTWVASEGALTTDNTVTWRARSIY